MKTFTIGDYRFDIISHETLVQNDTVRERFVVDVFYQDKPLNWHPNQQGADDFPGIPNRQIFEWIGKVSVDVYNDAKEKVGTKRGADFRGRFWSTLMLKAEKALVASKGKRPISQVTDAELAKAVFVEPVALKTKSLDAAASELTTVRAVR